MHFKSRFALVAIALLGTWSLHSALVRSEVREARQVNASEIDAVLRDLWDKAVPASATGNARTNAPEWQMKQTTWLPNEWPPTPRTLWARYVYGLDVALDGASGVSAPIARIERKSGSDTGVTIIPMDNRLKEVGTHPVRPHGGWNYTLADEQNIFSRLFSLKALPNDTRRLSAYYHSWCAGNAEIAAQVSSRHRAFFSWLDKQPRQ